MEYVLEMKNITKRFPGITANKDVNFALKKQEVHALLGENGAGKSTLMSILFGLYEPDEGQIYINGEPVKIKNPNQATAYRIGMVHQHFKLVKTFSALQNIVLGIEPTKLGLLNTESVREKIESLSKQYKFNIDLDMKISDMTVGMQQKVEILKMLFRDNDILIFDEPTAVLLPQETEELLDTIRLLVKQGKSVIFISHKLNEIMEVADRCTILRKGEYAGTYVIKDTNVSELSRRMVGREVDLKPVKNPQKSGENILSVRNLIVKDPVVGKNVVNDVSFDVRKGEICCIAGIDGNGQTELIYAISGLLKIDSGSVIINGQECTNKGVRYRNQQGMSHIPEDRHRHGLILDYTVAQNAILETHQTEEMSHRGILKRQYISDYTKKLIEKYDVRCGKGEYTISRCMSGGNQQKLIIARELEKEHDIIIAVQPTRGLDVGAIEFVHKCLIRERDNGKAVLLISLELDEVMDISDRILVIYEGELVGELDPEQTTREELGLYMAGAKRKAE